LLKESSIIFRASCARKRQFWAKNQELPFTYYKTKDILFGKLFVKVQEFRQLLFPLKKE
jgi:hypothetical protein